MSLLGILEPGSRLGKYQIQAHIATGGMGAVYKAFDTGLNRVVALKVLPEQLAKRESDLGRFRREARLAARLSHKHIVTLFDYQHDTERNLHYLALEYVDGIDLGQHIERKGRLQPEDARRILIQATKALQHAFSRGVIHRDIKPSNFLLAQVNGKVVVKLTDLGLALVQGEDDDKMTKDGSTVGTVDYMAPEQARDSRATDIRSDIYSLGCTGFHMLAGRPPFEGGLGERVFKHMQEPPPDIRQFSPTVSPGFWRILQKMLAKSPEDRYAKPAELLHALNRTPAEVSGEKPAVAVPPLRSPERTTNYEATPTPTSLPASPDESADEGASTPKPRSTPRAGSAAASSSGAIAKTLVSVEQARAAAVFYERALQVLNQGEDDAYTRELLANCLKLDPFNLTYLKTLREVNKKVTGGMLGRFFGSLNVLAIKSKMRLARSNGDFRKVLEHGEEILSRQPADVDTHMEMAVAAEGLGLQDLAFWFLEQGREQAPDNTALLRALARQYERLKDLKRAIALLERVHELEPKDHELKRKIDELSVQAHFKRGNYRR